MKSIKNKKNISNFLQSSLMSIVVLFLIFTYVLTSINISSVKNFRLFADITTQDLVSLVNKERQQKGLRPLMNNSKLDQTSYMKAQDMVRNDYFAHYSPQGVSPWYWFDQAGYYYEYAGENLAIDFVDAKTAVAAWMNSPLHRENILNKDYTETGIAVVKVKTLENKSRNILVQTFGSQFEVDPVVAMQDSKIKENEFIAENDDVIFEDIAIASEKVTTSITLMSRVLGITQVQVKDNISTSDLRTKEEAVSIIEQISVTKQQKSEMMDIESQRILENSTISSNDRFKYFLTAFFNSNVSKVINLISGTSLLCLGVVAIFIFKKKKELKIVK